MPSPSARPDSQGASDEERAARAELTWLAVPGDRDLGTFVRVNGAQRAMTLIRAGHLPPGTCVSMTPGTRRSVSRWHDALRKVPLRGEVRRALDGPFRLLCPGDPEWPAQLDDLADDAPVALWATGASYLRFSLVRSVAVTGSRAASAYGSHLAAELGASLAARGVTVVSGASFGVDASAHRGALAADGVTVAVLAGGLDVPYPAAHAELLRAISAQGALVSEAPPGTLPGRLRFQARQRITAALASSTLIVEAAARSGATAVARHARDLGRPVMAVPGPVTSELSAGCHDLIRHGHAVLVTSADDVTETLDQTARPAAG